MIILSLGMPGSASTWAFNVLREILEISKSRSASIFAEDVGTLVSNISPGTKNILIKAHSLDRGYLRLIECCECPVVVTTRHPQDSVLSMIERFGWTNRQALSAVSASMATIATLANARQVFSMSYESKFTESEATVDLLAKAILANIKESDRAAIFQKFSREQVAKWITGKFPKEGLPDQFDHDTHWHNRHIGDGVIGKGACRLPEPLRSIAIEFGPIQHPIFKIDGGKPHVRWSNSLFAEFGTRFFERAGSLRLNTDSSLLVSGPNLFLPTSRWKISCLIKDILIKTPITLLLRAVAGTPLGEKRIEILPDSDPVILEFEFDHHWHSHALDIQLFRMSEPCDGHLFFGGVELHPLTTPLPISPTVLASHFGEWQIPS